MLTLRKHFVLVPNMYTYSLLLFVVSFYHFLLDYCIFKQATAVPIIPYKKVNNKVYFYIVLWRYGIGSTMQQ